MLVFAGLFVALLIAGSWIWTVRSHREEREQVREEVREKERLVELRRRDRENEEARQRAVEQYFDDWGERVQTQIESMAPPEVGEKLRAKRLEESRRKLEEALLRNSAEQGRP